MIKVDKKNLIFAFITLTAYLIGYRLYALDRSIDSWIKIIHYLSPLHVVILILTSFALSLILSKIRLKEKHYPFIVVGVAFLFSLPLLGLPQINPDSMIYYTAARYIKDRGLVEGLTTLRQAGFQDLPGYPLLLYLTYLLHEGSIATQALHLFFYIIITALTYLIGKEVWGSKTGFYASLLTASTPFIITNHWFALQDMPLLAFSLASLYTVIKIKEDRRWLLLAIPLTLFTLTIKVSGVLYLFSTIPPIVFIQYFDKQDNRQIKLVVAAALIFSLAFSALVYLTPSFKEKIGEHLNLVSVKKNVSRFFTVGSHVPTISMPYQIGFPQSFLFLGFLYYSLKNRDKRNLLIYFWLIIPFIVTHDTKLRYFLPSFPAISLAAAQTITHLKGVEKQKIITYFTCLAMAAPMLWASPQIAQDYVIKNISDIARQTNQLDVKDVGVYLNFMPKQQHPHYLISNVDYESNKKIFWLGYNFRLISGWHWSKHWQFVNEIYPNQGYKPDEVQELLDENYTLVSSESGGIYYYRNPYHNWLYIRKEDRWGPVDAIIYSSNINIQDELFEDKDYCENFAVNFFCADDVYNDEDQFRGYFHGVPKNYNMQYSFGPIKLGGVYGKAYDSWLGEPIIYMKPPNEGQVNATYNVSVPENTILRFSISLRPDTWHPLKGDGVEFLVYVGEDILFQKYLDPKTNPEDRRMHQYEVDISAYWGSNTTFVFMTQSGPDENSMYDTAGWGNPRIELL